MKDKGFVGLNNLACNCLNVWGVGKVSKAIMSKLGCVYYYVQYIRKYISI